MKKYSQNNEDWVLMQYFMGEKPDDLCVLDIGANDGKTFSNSLRAIQAGWNACLIEPAPSALKELTYLHDGNKRVNIFPYAISLTSQDDAVFHESGSMLNKGDTALVSSLNAGETTRWKESKVPYHTMVVATRTFDEFLNDSPIKKFDAISIDCEGEDLNVLQQIDLDAVGCRMIIVEFNGKEEEVYTAYVSVFGFKLIDKNAENLIFAR